MGVKIIEVNKSVYADNNAAADETRQMLKEQGTCMINLMASPGAGKTTLLLKTISMLKDTWRIGVMEADIDAAVDAEAMQAAGVTSVQVHTGGECAMNAGMTKRSLESFDSAQLDLMFLENVGNLVCPAEEDTGASANVAILSVPEGDDKPLKYPLMFEVVDLVLISKIDTKSFFTFNDEAVIRNIRERNPKAEIIFLSAKTGEGMDDWCRWLNQTVENWKNSGNS